MTYEYVSREKASPCCSLRSELPANQTGTPVNKSIHRTIDPADPDSDLLNRAARVLQGGGVVAYPTESSYGLGADARNVEACLRIFRIKGRDAHNPLPLLIPHADWLSRWSRAIPPETYRLTRLFWPGALTLVVRAGKDVPEHLVSVQGSVGLRLPRHPVALGLASSLGSPITGTSANLSGRAGITDPAELLRHFEKEIDLLLDGGTTSNDPPSTVVDVSGDGFKILREGPVTRRMIADALDGPSRRGDGAHGQEAVRP